MDGLDTISTDEINERIRATKDHQLKRLDYFLELDSNKDNKERLSAL